MAGEDVPGSRRDVSCGREEAASSEVDTAWDREDDELRAMLQRSPLLRLVGLAGHVTSQRFAKVLAGDHGLTPSGEAVLGVLAWGSGRGFDQGTPGRATHAELARRCWVTRGTLTGIVDTLEKGGYVRRERDGGDRRVVWLVLTDAGRERVAAVGQRMAQAFTATTAEQDPVKVEAIREFLIELIMKHYEPAQDGEG